MIRRLARTALAAGLLVSWSPEAVAREWFVAPGATGTGTRAAPFGSVQAAIVAARPGDTFHADYGALGTVSCSFSRE